MNKVFGILALVGVVALITYPFIMTILAIARVIPLEPTTSENIIMITLFAFAIAMIAATAITGRK